MGSNDDQPKGHSQELQFTDKVSLGRQVEITTVLYVPFEVQSMLLFLAILLLNSVKGNIYA